MKLLLDTHVFIWSVRNTKKLSENVISLLIDTNNTWFISIASVWELQIKYQIGKLNRYTFLLHIHNYPISKSYDEAITVWNRG
jgi:PIN domain nuclease of toxin-antitoxin system